MHAELQEQCSNERATASRICPFSPALTVSYIVHMTMIESKLPLQFPAARSARAGPSSIQVPYKPCIYRPDAPLPDDVLAAAHRTFQAVHGAPTRTCTVCRGGPCGGPLCVRVTCLGCIALGLVSVGVLIRLRPLQQDGGDRRSRRQRRRVGDRRLGLAGEWGRRPSLRRGWGTRCGSLDVLPFERSDG